MSGTPGAGAKPPRAANTTTTTRALAASPCILPSLPKDCYVRFEFVTQTCPGIHVMTPELPVAKLPGDDLHCSRTPLAPRGRVRNLSATHRDIGKTRGLSCERALVIIHKLRIELSRTIRADAVGELGLGMLHDVALYGLPIAFVIAYLFAGGANRQQSTQGPHLVKGIPKLPNKPLALDDSLLKLDVFLL